MTTRWRRSRPACAARGCASRTSSCCSRRITISTTSASPPRSSAARARPWPCSTRMADYAARYSAEVEEDRRFARALMTHHGVPEQVVADTEELLGLHPRHDRGLPRRRAPRRRRSRSGGRAQPAGHRATRATARRTRCSSTTRDGIAFAGDHLLATISSNTEICAPDRAHDGRARSRLRYLENLELTAGDAARAAAHRPRRAGHRAQAARRRAPARPSPPLRAHPRRSSTTVPARRSRSPAGCGPRGR